MCKNDEEHESGNLPSLRKLGQCGAVDEGAKEIIHFSEIFHSGPRHE